MYYLEKDGEILTANSDIELIKNILAFIPDTTEADIKEGDIVFAYDNKFYLRENAPRKSDTEIRQARQNFYSSISDSVFASYSQGGGATLQDYFDSKAQIKFENKLESQADMTLEDFKTEVEKEFSTSPYSSMALCLSAVSTQTVPVTTTPIVVKAESLKVAQFVSYDSLSGELTFNSYGSHLVFLGLKIDSSVRNKKLELWIEKFDGAVWVPVPDSGLVRSFLSEQEVEIGYVFTDIFNKGDKFRLRAVSDASSGIRLLSTTLSNGIKMPSVRLSVY
jgi:hypothetical protein